MDTSDFTETPVLLFFFFFLATFVSEALLDSATWSLRSAATVGTGGKSGDRERDLLETSSEVSMPDDDGALKLV